MREPTAETEAFGMLAEFTDAPTLIDAIERARAAGFRQIEAYTPFPVEEVFQALSIRDDRVPWITLAGGIIGAACGYGVQVYINLDYPIDVGGRPLLAPPAFILSTVVLTILFAVLAAIVGMLVLNHLPRLHHPLFGVERFGVASADRFFLAVFSTDPKFHRDRTRGFLEELRPVRIDLVEHTEEPE